MRTPLRTYTIFNSPADFPGLYVLRLRYITAGENKLSDEIVTNKTLAGIREAIPLGLVRVPRHKDDAPSIVETWI